MRGEWIEIVKAGGAVVYDENVSPHAGRVD